MPSYSFDVTSDVDTKLHGSDLIANAGAPSSIPELINITFENITPFAPGGGGIIGLLGEFTDGTYSDPPGTDVGFANCHLNEAGTPFGSRQTIFGSTHGGGISRQFVTEASKACTFHGIAIQCVMTLPLHAVVRITGTIDYPDTPFADDPTTFPITSSGITAPSGLQANFIPPELTTPNKNQLTWIDNADNETGFIIESSFTEAGDDFVPVAIVYSVDLETWYESSVDRVHIYRYRVRAFNATERSEASNVATIPPDDSESYTWTLDTDEAAGGDLVTISSPDGNPSLLDITDIHLDWVDADDNPQELILDPFDAITWTALSLIFKFPFIATPPPPDGTVTIVPTIFGGSVTLGTLTYLDEIGSGIYRLVNGKSNDTIYVDSTVDDTTRDVAMPNPFIVSGYVGG